MDTNKLDIKIKRDLLKLVKNQINVVSLNNLDVNKIKKHKDFKNHAKFIDYFAKNNINDIAIINNKLIKKRTIIKNIMLKLLLYCVLIIFLHHRLLYGPQAPVKVSFYNPTFSTIFFICIYLGCSMYLFYGYLFYDRKKKLKKEPIDEYLIFLHKVKNRIEALSDREIYLMLNKKELSNNKYRILRCFSKIKTINK